MPTSIVEAKKVVRHYTKVEQADLDIKTSVNKIGEIINLSQELNTQLWHMMNDGAGFEELEELYCDISKLDILSGIEIDKAKKEFAVDSVAEIKKLKKKYMRKDNDGRQIKPNFFGKIARMKGYYDSQRKNYCFHNTTMDYLQHSLNTVRMAIGKTDFMPFSELLISKDDFLSRSVKYAQVNRVLELVRIMRNQIKAVWSNPSESMDNYEKSVIANEIKEECYSYIKSIQFSRHTAYRLLLDIEAYENKDISRSLFYMLFSLPNQSFVELLQASREPIGIYEMGNGGEDVVYIYDMPFVKRTIVPEGCAIVC